MHMAQYMAAMLDIPLSRISIITPYTGRDQSQDVSIRGRAVGGRLTPSCYAAARVRNDPLQNPTTCIADYHRNCSTVRPEPRAKLRMMHHYENFHYICRLKSAINLGHIREGYGNTILHTECFLGLTKNTRLVAHRVADLWTPITGATNIPMMRLLVLTFAVLKHSIC
jgi:hypothetical protein